MKSIFLKVTLLIFVCSIGLYLSAQNVAMDINQFEAKLKSAGTNVQLIDVRTSDEFNKDHLQGAINYDIYESDFETNVGKLNKSKPIFVYCYSGGRSSQAANIMKKKGFKTIYDMSEGFKKWKTSGKPVTK